MTNRQITPNVKADKWQTADLVLKNISKTFRTERENLVAVRDFSLTIKKGHFVTLLGPSGCGKTTTLRIVAGFEKADQGEIYLGDKRIDHLPAHARNMPMVFQSYALFPHLTIFENIAYGLKIRKVKKEEIQNNVEMALQVLNLAGVENRYPGELSGGQQQRVALARSIVLKPKIILFDEPLSNLDVKLRLQTRLEIKRIQQLLGITILYVTHDQSEAMALSDVTVLMNKGKIEQIGSPEEIYNQPKNIFVADFIGNSNFIDGRINKIFEREVTVAIDHREVRVPRANMRDALGENTEVCLAIKPDAIHLAGKPEGFKGRLLNKSFLGSTIEYEIEFQNSYLTCVRPSSAKNPVYQDQENNLYFDFLNDSFQILEKIE